MPWIKEATHAKLRILRQAITAQQIDRNENEKVAVRQRPPHSKGQDRRIRSRIDARAHSLEILRVSAEFGTE